MYVSNEPFEGLSPESDRGGLGVIGNGGLGDLPRNLSHFRDTVLTVGGRKRRHVFLHTEVGIFRGAYGDDSLRLCDAETRLLKSFGLHFLRIFLLQVMIVTIAVNTLYIGERGSK